MGRRMKRNLRTPRGALLFLMGLLVFALWLGPSVAMSIKEGGDPAFGATMLPVIMLTMCIVSLGSSAGEPVSYTHLTLPTN